MHATLDRAAHDAWLKSLGDSELGTVVARVTDSDAWHLLVSAFEGGSNYWARIDNSKPYFTAGNEKPYTYLPDVPFLGGSIAVEQSDGGDYEPCPFVLTRERCLAAFQLMAEKHPHHWQAVCVENTDAETGDVFLQLAVLGDVVYG